MIQDRRVAETRHLVRRDAQGEGQADDIPVRVGGRVGVDRRLRFLRRAADGARDGVEGQARRQFRRERVGQPAVSTARRRQGQRLDGDTRCPDPVRNGHTAGRARKARLVLGGRGRSRGVGLSALSGGVHRPYLKLVVGAGGETGDHVAECCRGYLNVLPRTKVRVGIRLLHVLPLRERTSASHRGGQGQSAVPASGRGAHAGRLARLGEKRRRRR